MRVRLILRLRLRVGLRVRARRESQGGPPLFLEATVVMGRCMVLESYGYG